MSDTFISSEGWFSFTLPDDWAEYETEDEEDTYAFFNTKKWTGNFRITPIRWTNVADENEDKAADFISKEVSKNDGAIKIKLGKLDCAHYKKAFLQEDGDKSIIYYWITGKKNILFICSFTINNEIEQTEQELLEIQLVQDMIGSIKINETSSQQNGC